MAPGTATRHSAPLGATPGQAGRSAPAGTYAPGVSESEAVLRDLLLVTLLLLAILKTRDLCAHPDDESSLHRVEVLVPKFALIALKVAAVVLLVVLTRDLLVMFL